MDNSSRDNLLQVQLIIAVCNIKSQYMEGRELISNKVIQPNAQNIQRFRQGCMGKKSGKPVEKRTINRDNEKSESPPNTASRKSKPMNRLLQSIEEQADEKLNDNIQPNKVNQHANNLPIQTNKSLSNHEMTFTNSKDQLLVNKTSYIDNGNIMFGKVKEQSVNDNNINGNDKELMKYSSSKTFMNPVNESINTTNNNLNIFHNNHGFSESQIITNPVFRQNIQKVNYQKIPSKWEIHKDKISEALRAKPQYTHQMKQLIAGITVNQQLTNQEIFQNSQVLLDLAISLQPSQKELPKCNFGDDLDLHQLINVFEGLNPKSYEEFRIEDMQEFMKDPTYAAEIQDLQKLSMQQLKNIYVDKTKATIKQMNLLIESTIQLQQSNAQVQQLLQNNNEVPRKNTKIPQKMHKLQQEQNRMNRQLSTLFYQLDLNPNQNPQDQLSYYAQQCLEIEAKLNQLAQKMPAVQILLDQSRNEQPHHQIVRIILQPLLNASEHIEDIEKSLFPEFDSNCNAITKNP